MLDITAAHRAYLSRQTHSRPSRRTRTAQRFAARQTSSRCQTCIAPRGRAHDMTADVGSFAEAAKNARLHALCSRPMRLIPAFPLSSGEAETGIKALLSHKVTGARVMNRMKDLRPRWHQGIAASSPWSLSDLIWSTDVSNFDQTPVRQRA
jgi:hypothetical protein